MTLKHIVNRGKWIGPLIMMMAFPARDFIGSFVGDATIFFGLGLAIGLGTADLMSDFEEGES